MADKKGAVFPQFSDDSERVAREFMKSPEAFAKKLGMSPADLNCPPAAHEAMERGETFAKKAAQAQLKPDGDSMTTLDGMARDSFGDDFSVELIPFGLRFRERAELTAELTATAAGTVTWLDTDAGVDS